jgi:hypothetical protein
VGRRCGRLCSPDDDFSSFQPSHASSTTHTLLGSKETRKSNTKAHTEASPPQKADDTCVAIDQQTPHNSPPDTYTHTTCEICSFFDDEFSLSLSRTTSHLCNAMHDAVTTRYRSARIASVVVARLSRSIRFSLFSFRKTSFFCACCAVQNSLSLSLFFFTRDSFDYTRFFVCM